MKQRAASRGIGYKVLTVLVLTAMALTGCQHDTKTVASDPIRAIKTIEVHANNSIQGRQLSGYIRAADQSKLSFQVSGQVQKIHVNIGDEVREGQSLALLDPQAYQFRQRQAEAELASARVELKEREDNFHRQQQVYRKKFISKNTLERAEADYQKAQSAVNLAESKLSLASRELRLTDLKAPFDGVITRSDIEPFEEVTTRNVVMELQGRGGLEVEFLVPATLLKSISRGGAVQVVIPAVDERSFSATIVEQGVSTDMRGAFPVRALIQAPGAALHAGMAAEVLLPVVNAGNLIRLPESAVVAADDGQQQVFVYDGASGQVHARAVETRLLDSESIQVISGLKEGDIVCIAGAEFLRDAQSVSLYQSKI